MGVADMVSTSTSVSQLLDGLLVLDAEALLLVDDQQAEVLELDALDQQPVGADDAVDLARLQPGDHGPRLRRAEEAGQHLDADRVAAEAVGEGVAVLLREERGGHQDRDLLAGLDGLERGPDGHLGLAEADVAAQQAVHREAGLHVVLHVADGDQLVGGLDEREALLQLVLPGRVVAEGEARERCAGAGTARPAPGRSPARRTGRGSWPSRSPRRRGGGAWATRRRRSGGRRRSGRTGRRACRRPCTRAAGSRARPRRSSA